jgi:hypothetical protein
LTLQQVTLKVIYFLHPQSLWQNCGSFKCLYKISYTYSAGYRSWLPCLCQNWLGIVAFCREM